MGDKMFPGYKLRVGSLGKISSTIAFSYYCPLPLRFNTGYQIVPKLDPLRILMLVSRLNYS